MARAQRWSTSVPPWFRRCRTLGPPCGLCTAGLRPHVDHSAPCQRKSSVVKQYTINSTTGNSSLLCRYNPHALSCLDRLRSYPRRSNRSMLRGSKRLTRFTTCPLTKPKEDRGIRIKVTTSQPPPKWVLPISSAVAQSWSGFVQDLAFYKPLVFVTMTVI
jgi:hypothetical protein